MSEKGFELSFCLKSMSYFEKLFSLLLRFAALFCCLLSFTNPLGAQMRLKGYVFEQKSKSPLAFVNISSGGTKTLGSSSIDGSFELKLEKLPDSLVFSFVGYERTVLKRLDTLTKDKIRVPMNPETKTLAEVEIRANENPALKIMRLVVQNRPLNDPEALDSYRCKTYNKFFATLVKEEAPIGIDPFAQKLEELNRLDPQEAIFLNTSHFFMMESVTERKYKRPDRALETVIANKVSGFKQPFFTTLANSFQPFSFYSNEVYFFGKTYTNPISKGSEKRYFFQMEDTIFKDQDTVYVISFEPQKSNEILKGVLYINTKGYALQNLIIVTKSSPDANFELHIQQQYERVEGKRWFPKQLNTDIIFKNETDSSQGIQIMVGGKSRPLKVVGRSYVSEIELNPELRSKEFGRMAIEWMPNANDAKPEILEKYRSEELTFAEKNTYTHIDTLFESQNIEKKLLALNYIMQGRVPLKFVDLELKRLLHFNRREGTRLGLGLRTNDKLSRHWNVGGYAGYGFKDMQWKYGSDLNFRLTKRNDLKLNLNYAQDLREAGGFSFFKDRNIMAGEQIRSYLINNFDITRTASVSLSGYLLKYLDFNLSLQNLERKITTAYRFAWAGERTAADSGLVRTTELHLGLRYSFRTTYVEFLGEQVPTSHFKYPILWLNLSKGFSGMARGEFDFVKAEAKVQKSLKIRGMGTSLFTVVGTTILQGKLPYSLIYTLPGSYVEDARIEAPNSLQTVGLNEFYGNRLLYAIYYHRFRQINWKKHCKPKFSLYGAAAWSWDSRPELHSNYILQTADRGLFESGLILQNLWVSRFSGFGVGVFYRHGHYALPVGKDNLVAKLSMTFTF
jgi:hypothetical protein